MVSRTLLRTLTTAALVALATGCASSPCANTAMDPTTTFDPSTQVQPATSVLRAYETALNRGDIDAIVSLYAPDAVFMAQHRVPAVGRAEIETAYRQILGVIRLDITFEIDEVVVVSPTVAYARTRSSGTTTILASDLQVSEGNQELFVLVRQPSGDDWRIGRYIFSTTRPPRS